MLDFTRVDFGKELKTVVVSSTEIETKWPLVKLKDICKEITAGGDKPTLFSKEKTEELTVPVYANGVINDGLQGYTNRAVVNETCVTISARGTLGFCSYHDVPFVPIVRLIVAKPTERIDCKYLYYTLGQVNFINEGSSTPQLSVPKVGEYKVPVPPMDIQKKIVEECEEIDTLVANSNEQAQKANAEIESVLNSIVGKRQPLKEFATFGNGRISYSDIKPDSYISTDNMLQNCEGVVPYDGIPNVSNVIAYHKGDILLSTLDHILKSYGWQTVKAVAHLMCWCCIMLNLCKQILHLFTIRFGNRLSLITSCLM